MPRGLEECGDVGTRWSDVGYGRGQAVKYTTKKIAKMRIQGEGSIPSSDACDVWDAKPLTRGVRHPGEEVNDKDSDDEDDEEAAGTAAVQHLSLSNRAWGPRYDGGRWSVP